MTAKRAAWAALLAATAAFFGQLAWYYPALPDRVASHFDMAGNPDGYTSKSSFAVLTSVVGGVVFALFAGLGWLLRKLPASLINMPHRHYWLAPERRDATVAVMTRKLLWYGAGTQVFMACVFHLAIRVNLDEGGTLSGWFWAVLIGYLGYTAAFLVALYRRFGRPPAVASTE